MNQNNIKRMFGSKRSLSLSETPDSAAQDSNIVVEAKPHYKREIRADEKDNHQKFYSEKELTPVQGSWDFQKSSPILEASLTDYLAQERMHTHQSKQGFDNLPPTPAHKSTMSLNDLKSQTGVYHDYDLSSHFDYSPAIKEANEHAPQDDFTGEEVPYNMSYLPEDSQALPGSKGYFLFTRLVSRAFMIFIAIITLPLLALAGLYFIQGPQSDQWVAVRGHVTHLVRYAQGSETTLFKRSETQGQAVNITSENAKSGVSNQRVGSSGSRQRRAALNSRKIAPKRFGVGGQVLSDSRHSVDIPLMITVSESDLSSDRRVKISGLPSNATLTKGHYMAAGVWMVSIADIPNIAMRVSGRLHHDIDLKASFLQDDGQTIELASYKIPQDFQPEEQMVVDKQKPTSMAQNTKLDKTRTRHMNLSSQNSDSTIPKIKRQAALKNLTQKSEVKANNAPVRIHPVYEQQQLNRASIYLAKSDFKTARDILEKTATSGSARAATALARSYDPKFLLKIKVRGIKPNLDKAKYWYQQAIKLGNASALNRLSQLK